MYSSMDKPTYNEWLQEYDRLLRLLQFNQEVYVKKLFECIKTEDAFMMKYYCLKLLDANKRLEFGKVELSEVE